MSLVRHMTMWSGGETSLKLSSHKQHFRWNKPLYLSHGWCYDYRYGSYTILEYKLFSADSSVSVVCRFRSSSSISPFFFFFTLNKFCVLLFYLSFAFLFDAKCHFALLHYLFFADIWGGQQGLKRFSSTFLMSCVCVCVCGDFIFIKLCTVTGG